MSLRKIHQALSSEFPLKPELGKNKLVALKKVFCSQRALLRHSLKNLIQRPKLVALLHGTLTMPDAHMLLETLLIKILQKLLSESKYPQLTEIRCGLKFFAL
jgi:hypothetical protein